MPLDAITSGLLERHLSRPFARYVSRLRNRVRDLNDLLQSPAALDQYPGRIQPYMYSRKFGPLPLTTPRRYDNDANNGFEKLATVASTGSFYTPANGNIKTDRRGTFVWRDTSIFTYITWTWSSNQALGSTNQKAFTSVSDIFDRVVENNGGALAMNDNLYYSCGIADDQPNVSLELGLYDKTRGRYLHDGTRLPIAMFSGQTFANRTNGIGTTFDLNTELEPRLYVDEIRIKDVLNTDTRYNACQFRAYVYLTFFGTLEQE